MMMDNGDYTMPKWEDPSKGLGDKMSNAGNSRCSTPASGVLSDEGSPPSDTPSVGLMFTQLYTEIENSKLLSNMEGGALEDLLQSKVKPLLEKIHADAHKVVVGYKGVGDSCHRKDELQRHILLHCPTLQEFVLKLGFSKNMDELQRYLISSDRTCLLSENDALKMELRDAQCRHQTVVKGLHLSLHSAEQESKGSRLSLQQNLKLSEDKLHSQEQKLKEYEGQLLSLQHTLMGFNDKTQGLQKTLRVSDMRLMSMQQDVEESEKRAQGLQHDLQVSQERNQTLEQNLASSEKNIQALRQNLSNFENKVQFHQHNHWASEEKVKSLQQALSSSEQEASLLQQSLKTSEEKVLSLQQNHWAAEEKAQSLQCSLSSSEEKTQSMQQRLRATDEKAKILKEALRSSEEKTQSLQEALWASESRFRASKAQQQSLEQCKGEQGERIQSLMQTLRASEEKHQSTMQDMQTGLHSERAKVEILQDALDRTESGHVKEVGQLQQKLHIAVKKGAAAEQELLCQVVALNSKLLEEQSNASKELERSVKYEKELQNTIKDLRQKLRIQTEDREFALDSLRKRQKDLAEVQRLLQADLLRCSQACGQEKGQQHFSLSKSGLKEEFVNLRTSLHSVLENDGGREQQRRQDWVEVLDKSKEWEKKAEKLVDSLNSMQSHHLLLKEAGGERHQYRAAAASPAAVWRSGTSPSSLVATLPQRTHSIRPSSPYPHGQYLGHEKKSNSYRGLKDSECVQHLLTVQKRLKKLQSVDFQKNVRGALRLS